MGGQAAPGRPANDGGALFERGELADYGRYVLASVRRHPLLCLSLVVLMTALAVALGALRPQSYTAEVRLLAMPEDPSDAAQRRSKGADPDAVAAAAVILRRDQLEALVDRHQLVEHWRQTRAPLSRFREALAAKLGAALPSDEEVRAALIAQLEEAISVEAAGGRVVVQVTWHEPQMAAALARSSQERFLLERTQSDLAAAAGEVEAVRRQVEASEGRVDAIVAALDTEARALKKGARPSSVAGLQAEGRFRETPDPALATLRLELIRKRRQLDALESERRARVSALTAKLAEQRTQLTEGNPLLQETLSRLAALEQPSSELSTLRADEQRLLSDYVSRGGKEVELTDEPQRAWPAAIEQGSSATELHKLKLAVELDQLSKLRLQLTQAQSDLEARSQKVRSRFALLSPASVPRESNGPGAGMVAVAGFFAGLVVALFAAVTRDLLSGRVLHPWQVERTLGLRVLSEVERC